MRFFGWVGYGPFVSTRVMNEIIFQRLSATHPRNINALSKTCDFFVGQGFCLTSPSGLKYFRPQFTSDESKSSKVIHKTNIGKTWYPNISDISWLYGLYFLDAQIAQELFEMPIDEKGWPHPMWGWWKMASSLSIHSNVKSGMNPCFLFGTPFSPWIIKQGFHSTEPALCDNFDCFEAWKTAATSGFEQGWICGTRKLWTVRLGMGE